jgi:outer membrane protein insertion porin family
VLDPVRRRRRFGLARLVRLAGPARPGSIAAVTADIAARDRAAYPGRVKSAARGLVSLLGNLAVAWAVLAPIATAHAQTMVAREQTIRAIEVEGNSKTTDDTVLLIARVQVGDRFDYNMLDRIRADLVNSGLFKAVEVNYAPTPEGNGMILVIKAEDKHSWIVAPTYYNQPTNKGGGLGFGENNLFGENKKLLVYGQIATGDSFLVAGYIDPSIQGTRFHWQADLFFKRERSIEYLPPADFLDEPVEARISKLDYLNLGVIGGVNLFRGASASVRLRGAKVSFQDVALAEGIALGDITDDPAATEPPDPGAEGYDVSAELRLEYDRRANWYGISHGERYRVYAGRALPFLGSDYDYWYGILGFQRARRYFDTHNLILNARLAYGQDLPFQQEFTSGGTAQRGYKNNQFRGDAQAALNIEYSLQALSIKGVSLRLLGFVDSSYTAFLDTDASDVQRHYLPGHDRLGLAPFKNTVGVGTRIYVRQIVLPLLGLDLGYGLERGDFEIYLAIGLTDV